MCYYIIYATAPQPAEDFFAFVCQSACEEAGIQPEDFEESEADSEERPQITRLSITPADSVVYGQQLLTTLNGSSINAFGEEDEMIHKTRRISKATLVITVSAISLCSAVAVAVFTALL